MRYPSRTMRNMHIRIVFSPNKAEVGVFTTELSPLCKFLTSAVRDPVIVFGVGWQLDCPTSG